MNNPSADELETNIKAVLPNEQVEELKQALNKIKQHKVMSAISEGIDIGEITKNFCGFEPKQQLSGLDKIVAVIKYRFNL